jgi:plastocyanin
MNMPPSSTYSSGNSGSGATHTVVVAPTKGVFRYVPFAVNASVGDTVKFIWGADEHTVTKSSELALCNKTSDAPFASGEQNQSFVCKNETHLLS